MTERGGVEAQALLALQNRCHEAQHGGLIYAICGDCLRDYAREQVEATAKALAKALTDARRVLTRAEEAAHSALNLLEAERQKIARLQDESAAWQATAAQESRNRDYYRALVTEIGELFGDEARTADDGGLAEDVLCAKVPALVLRLQGEVAALREALLNMVNLAAQVRQEVTPDTHRAFNAWIESARAALAPRRP